MSNYSKISKLDLDKKASTILKLLIKEKDLSVSQIRVMTRYSEKDIWGRILFLHRYGFIWVSKDSGSDGLPVNGFFSATTDGEIYFENVKTNNKVKVYEWIRYGITSLIAVAALVVSIIAVFKQ